MRVPIKSASTHMCKNRILMPCKWSSLDSPIVRHPTIRPHQKSQKLPSGKTKEGNRLYESSMGNDLRDEF